jgi:hypothetical protein
MPEAAVMRVLGRDMAAGNGSVTLRQVAWHG